MVRLLETGGVRLLEDDESFRLLELAPAAPIPSAGPPVEVYRLPTLEPVATPVTQQAIKGTRSKTGPGSGEFTIQLADPAYPLIQPGTDIMGFRRDGTLVHSCLIEETDEHVYDRDGTAKQVVTYLGRDAGIVLDSCPIFPAGGHRRKPVEEEMVGDWRSLRYDPTPDPWEAANPIMTVAAASGGGWPHQPMAGGMDLGTGAYMILSSAGDDTYAPAGWYLFRRLYDIPIGGRHGIEMLMDDLGYFWVDNILHADVPHTDGFVRASFKRLFLSEGPHLLTWAVFNAEDPENPGFGLGPAALAYNLYKSDLQDRPLAGGFYAVSDDDVEVLPTPDHWPSMVVGDLVLHFWEESVGIDLQVTHLVPTFTRSLDSNGDPWPRVADGTAAGITTKTATTTIWGFLAELQAAGHISRWRVRPDAVTWDIYGPGYTSRPDDISFTPAPADDPYTGQLTRLDRRRS